MKNNKTGHVIIGDKLMMQLFVSGMSQKSMEAIENIRNYCDGCIRDQYELEIIDIYKYPERAAAQQIVFCPSLIKFNPLPKRILIGNFSDTEKVSRALGITGK